MVRETRTGAKSDADLTVVKIRFQADVNLNENMIIISQRSSIKRAIEALILIWTASESEEYVDSIRHLDV